MNFGKTLMHYEKQIHTAAKEMSNAVKYLLDK